MIIIDPLSATVCFLHYFRKLSRALKTPKHEVNLLAIPWFWNYLLSKYDFCLLKEISSIWQIMSVIDGKTTVLWIISAYNGCLVGLWMFDLSNLVFRYFKFCLVLKNALVCKRERKRPIPVLWYERKVQVAFGLPLE